MNRHSLALQVLRHAARHPSHLVNLAGPAGCGKSALAAGLAAHFAHRTGSSVLYVDTMGKFSRQRFDALYGHLRVDAAVRVAVARDLARQRQIVAQVTNPDWLRTQSPPVGMVVVDSVSHHLRRAIALVGFTDYQLEVEGFYQDQLCPLLVTAARHRWLVVWVHEQTARPGCGELPFLADIFEAIPGLWLSLVEEGDDQAERPPNNPDDFPPSAPRRYQVTLSEVRGAQSDPLISICNWNVLR